MNEFIKKRIKTHANLLPELEVCGIILADWSDGSILISACKNISENPSENYIIDPLGYAKALQSGKKIIGFYHSHPKGGGPSKEDSEFCDEVGLPFVIYSLKTDEFYYLESKNFIPEKLEGRPFVLGHWDCYTIIRDYYRINYKIVLPYFFPPENDDLKDNPMFEENFEKAGFRRVEYKEAKEGDVILIKTQNSKTYNHAGIFVDGDKILNQQKKASHKSNLDERLLKYGYIVLRHKENG